MFNATNYALHRDADPGANWSAVGRDLVSGALVVARLAIVLAGCATLIVGGTIAVSGDARARLIERVIEVVTRLPGAAIAAADRLSSDRGGGAESTVGLVEHPVDRARDPQQSHVAQYLAKRYRIADEAAGLIVASAFDAGRSIGLDPLLILAVTAIESSLNPFAQSPVGAQGLMQVMTRVHSEKFEPHGGDRAALDPVANVKVGSMILKELVRRGGSVERGLQLYVGAGNLPDDSGYAARVLAEHNRLSIAAAGRPERALAGARVMPQPLNDKPERADTPSLKSTPAPAAQEVRLLQTGQPAKST